jgi:carbamoyl-phosphate synthase large subunit
MTDPETADRTYIGPMTPEAVEQIIAKEKPDAILPTMGGQTALNLAKALSEGGALERHGVELIGAKLASINKAEDRELFADAMVELKLGMAKSAIATNMEEAMVAYETIGRFPLIIRPAFTLGGTGGGIAYNMDEFRAICAGGLEASMTSQVQIEESLLGWKEFELEVMRDLADNVVIICSIENVDPMGVHTGDSITVAPAQTLTDKEYQRLRDASVDIIRSMGVECGGSNVQMAINPANGDMVIIEMNPRVSRSSALASKATGELRRGRGCRCRCFFFVFLFFFPFGDSSPALFFFHRLSPNAAAATLQASPSPRWPPSWRAATPWTPSPTISRARRPPRSSPRSTTWSPRSRASRSRSSRAPPPCSPPR